MNKKIYWTIISLLLILISIGVVYNYFIKEKPDNIKFYNEYNEVGKNNVFVYKSIEEIINILENGTGVIYLGFPECPWCQSYVKYINDVAKETGIKEIYYFNILDDRKTNSEEYQKIVTLLNEVLLEDENGNKRIFVPDVTIVNKGKIIGHDNETSVIEGYESPKEYWTDEKVDALKSKLKKLFSEISTVCTSCN
ncbi:MAG: hypothetical protein IJB82_03790 [Bacilli bacterium]|nr:hypothetical protein [Bacilli bacterium]